VGAVARRAVTHGALRVVLVTGATGNLGALAAARLLQQGHRVYAIVRSRSRRSLARRRAEEAILYLGGGTGLPEALRDRLTVLEGDVGDAESLAAVRPPEPIDEIWHFASSLKYMPRDRDEIHEANVGGMANMLRLHAAVARHDAPLYYASTAYAAGKLAFVPETRIPFDEQLGFNNEYEKSKLIAEGMLLEAIASGTLRGAVFRPSIVVGMLETGRLVNYNGFYLGLKAWMALSQYMSEHGRAGEVVRTWLDPDNALNLIPLDRAVDAMLGSAPRFRDGEVVNVVNRIEVTLARVFELMEGHLAIRPVLVGTKAPMAGKTTYEKLVAYSLTYTAPYTKQRIAFAADRLAGSGQEVCVTLYPTALDRMMRTYYARGEDDSSEEAAASGHREAPGAH
jgi:nucleoside-diphosphate-sugar epimerase